jgi:uncharacterized protein (TIGR02271 family)
MKDLAGKTVIDSEGAVGRVVALEPSDEVSGAGGAVRLRIEGADAPCLVVPWDALEERADGRLLLPFSFAEVIDHAVATAGEAAAEHRIPVIEERPVVRKRQAVTGTVRVTKRVRQWEEMIDEPLLRERVEVTRVPVGAWVEAPVPVRQDGDTTIVPLLEEVLVVEKRLRLVEEVHIRKHRTEAHEPKAVTLRREEAIVEPEGARSEEITGGRPEPGR